MMETAVRRGKVIPIPETKTCTKCEVEKPMDDFHNDKSRWDGKTHACKACRGSNAKKWKESNVEHLKAYRRRPDVMERTRKATKAWRETLEGRANELERTSTYEAAKLERMPTWVDREAIKEVYRNRPEGMEVDHIIPLRGRTVSGLHVAENLQYLTRKENARKWAHYGE